MTDEKACCTPATKTACGPAASLILGLVGGVLASAALFFVGPNLPPPPPQTGAAMVAAESDAPARVLKGLAVMDLQQILANSKAGKALETQVDAAREDLRRQVEQEEKGLEGLEKKLAEARDAGEREQFMARRAEFEKKIAQARETVLKKKQGLDEALGRALDQLRQEVVRIAKEMGQERGYALVTTRQSVVIVAEDLDITADVLAVLDETLPSVKMEVK
ncbi:MAG: OmpH family outer membrane protein [Alphaproteobacteria bacterium]|jgi:outer membrane protein|nr:OmpH family outer membrane protein [Alphaproteobacteria bacterium]